MKKHVLTEQLDGVLTIILNRPEKRNAIGIEMIRTLIDILTGIESDKNVKVVKITGSGDKAFSAGGDLKEFKALDKQGIINWIQSGHKAFHLLENLSKPTIAMISGYCLGGGLELAIACDFRIADETAIFGSPELKYGWIPGWGGLSRLKRIVGESKAKEIIMLAENFDADKAKEMGLLYKVTKARYIEEESKILVDRLSKIDPFVFSMAKRAIMESNDSQYEYNQMFDVLATLYSKDIR